MIALLAVVACDCNGEPDPDTGETGSETSEPVDSADSADSARTAHSAGPTSQTSDTAQPVLGLVFDADAIRAHPPTPTLAEHHATVALAADGALRVVYVGGGLRTRLYDVVGDIVEVDDELLWLQGSHPQVALDHTGTGWLVVSRQGDGVQLRSWDGAWSQPTAIDTSPGTSAYPDVVAHPTDVWWAVWKQATTVEEQTRGAHGPQVTGFAIPKQVADTRGPVAIDSNGDRIAIAWVENADDMTLFVRRGTNTREVSTSDAIARPDIALTATDDFGVVWHEQFDDDVWLRVFRGGFGAPVQLNPAGTHAARPAIVEIDGNYIVVWEQEGTNGLDVYAQLFDGSGGALTAAVVVADDSVDEARPDIAVTALQDGRLRGVVSWETAPEGTGGVYLRAFTVTSN